MDFQALSYFHSDVKCHQRQQNKFEHGDYEGPLVGSIGQIIMWAARSPGFESNICIVPLTPNGLLSPRVLPNGTQATVTIL